MAQQRAHRTHSRPAWGCLLLALLGLALLAWVFTSHLKTSRMKQDAERQAQRQAEARNATLAAQERQRQDVIDHLVQKHHAIRDWEKQFRGQYTVDVQEALIHREGQPVIFTAYLRDIERVNDRYILSFGPLVLPAQYKIPFFDPRPLYLIECDPGSVQTLRKDTPQNFEGLFAVVARISSVSRPHFEVRATEGEDTPSLVLAPSDTAHVVQGRCVEVIPLPPSQQPAAPANPSRR